MFVVGDFVELYNNKKMRGFVREVYDYPSQSSYLIELEEGWRVQAPIGTPDLKMAKKVLKKPEYLK